MAIILKLENRNMNNKIYLKSSMVLVVTLGLTACNGGGSTTTSSSAPQISELQQYINLLQYTPLDAQKNLKIR